MIGMALNAVRMLPGLAGVGTRINEHWQPRRVLVTRIQNLGDCVVFIPTLQALREIWPETRIDVLAGTSVGEAVFRMVPGIDSILRTNWPGPLTGKEKQEQISILTEGKYDALLLSTEETGMALKGFLSGIPLRAGFTRIIHMNEHHRERLPFLLTHRLEQPDGLHEAEVNCQLARLFGYSGQTPACELSIPNEIPAEANLLLDELDIQPGQYICVHPGTSQPVKNWGIHNFAEACDLIAASGLTPVFVGIPQEEELILQIQSAMRHESKNLVGRTPLPVLASVFQSSSGFLGNDSGPMHLAAATGIPVTAVFVASLPQVWGPWNPTSDSRVFLPDEAKPQVVASSVIHLSLNKVEAGPV